MADPVLVQVLTAIGGIGTLTALGRFFIAKPLEEAKEHARSWELRAQRAEQREDEQRARADMLAGELKATADALRSMRRLDERETGAPLSTPPRAELPTLEHIIESRADRAWAEQRERERQRPLNRPAGPAPPLAGMRPPRIPAVREEYAPGARPTPPAPNDYPGPLKRR